ncbi:hypothetical protein ACFYY8_06340 [Streptosporangium sp. NPDC001559]|uniref:hypothetical protein n=1 Tax=Streptosporangium sp. NPDC001559 TaxID=3366187 RepID=UPI0036E5FA48
MTWRHTHVTQHLYAPHEAKTLFVAELRKHFRQVYALPNEDTISWITFADRDTDNVSDELAMPDVLSHLDGILPHDIEIVSAWEQEQAPIQRTRVWLVRGSEPTETDIQGRAAKYLDPMKPYGSSQG